MCRQVNFAKVEFLFEGGAEGVWGDIHHSHVVRANKVFCDDVSGDLLSGFVVVVYPESCGTRSDGVTVGSLSDA